MTPEHVALLKLVRLGIGQFVESDSVFGEEEWEKVYVESRKQSVASIAFDGLLEAGRMTGINCDEVRMGADDIIGEELYLRWLALTSMAEEEYERCKQAISGLASLLNENGFDLMLLKGYGLSLNYSIPEHRPCGDIDVWLFGKQKEADELFNRMLHVNPIESSHHTIFFYKGFEVENHISFIEKDCSRGKENETIEGLMNEKHDIISVNGSKVFLPSSNLNAFFLLRHTSGHFTTEKIQLRHLLDWGFFVKKNSERINWSLIWLEAEKWNMHIFLDCLNSICVDYLGFDDRLFPVRKRYDDLESRIINDIMCPEFNRTAPPMKSNFIKYCYIKSKRNFANRWKYKITQKDGFLYLQYRFAKNRLLHPQSFRDVLKKQCESGETSVKR